MPMRTTESSDVPSRAIRRAAGPDVEIVVPVYNEEHDLTASVRRLSSYLQATFPWTHRITIADNASTDATWAIACGLADELPDVRAVHLADKGRGRALKTVWMGSDATVVAYMDVDLSTDLAALAPLVAPLLSGHSDVAIGTRLARGARVVRGTKRELISRGYNAILRTTLRARFSDAQCGFKAIRSDRARELLPLVEDTGWFFDTEMLVLADRTGMRIHEVPVDWTDDPDSRVDIVSTAIADLKGVARLLRGLTGGRIPVAELRARLGTGAETTSLFTQTVRFAAIGVASTLAYLLLFVSFRTFVPALVANAIALVVTTIGNTAANCAFTFEQRGRRGVLWQQAQGFVVLGVALAVTSGSLVALHAAASHPGPLAEGAVLVIANLVASVLRFVLLRGWVFRAGAAASSSRRQS